jgi:SAM-dependent methyltransferase
MRAHARDFVEELLKLRGARAGLVVNVASHGGFLHSFLSERGVQSLVVEGSPALVADQRAKGVLVHAQALGRSAAADILVDRPRASLVVDNYLLSHVPDPNALVAGIADLLAPGGWAVFELDHVLPIIVEGQFDAFRHGHFTYWSLTSFDALIRRHGLAVVDVTEQPVYGGALRITARWAEEISLPAGGVVGTESELPAEAVSLMFDKERAAGLDEFRTYERFAMRVASALRELREFLGAERTAGRLVAGYGAPTRGSTLLNAAGIGPELLPFTVDRSPTKQGLLMPGCRIPIERPEHLLETSPEVVLILTWDISAEIVAQQIELRDRGARFMVPIPALEVVGA